MVRDMKLATAALALTLPACACAPSGGTVSLPHRADWEMFSIQGHATGPACDGPDVVRRIPFYVFSEDGTAFFVECQ